MLRLLRWTLTTTALSIRITVSIITLFFAIYASDPMHRILALGLFASTIAYFFGD